MKIRRLYYEESKMSDRIIEEKVKAKMCKMSEEEQIRDKKQKLMEAQVIVEMAKMKIDAKLNNISQERVKHFEKMAKKALHVAQELFLNVEIFLPLFTRRMWVLQSVSSMLVVYIVIAGNL